MDKITDNINLNYSAYLGQTKELRKIAISKLGAEKVAMMSNDDVYDYFRKSGYVPFVVYLNDGCNFETIFLVKEDMLNTDDVIKLYR